MQELFKLFMKDSINEAVEANLAFHVGKRLKEVLPYTEKKMDQWKLTPYESHNGWSYARQQKNLGTDIIIKFLNNLETPMSLAEFFSVAQPGMKIVHSPGSGNRIMGSGNQFGNTGDCTSLEEKVELLERLLK